MKRTEKIMKTLNSPILAAVVVAGFLWLAITSYHTAMEKQYAKSKQTQAGSKTLSLAQFIDRQLEADRNIHGDLAARQKSRVGKSRMYAADDAALIEKQSAALGYLYGITTAKEYYHGQVTSKK